jgi:hypothetical protein
VLVEYNTKEGSLCQETGSRTRQDLNQTAKETTMNAFATAYRNLTCAAAAVVICTVCSMAFVESTAVVPGSGALMTPIAHAAAPSWFGQPAPAVLVD